MDNRAKEGDVDGQEHLFTKNAQVKISSKFDPYSNDEFFSERFNHTPLRDRQKERLQCKAIPPHDGFICP